VSKTQLLCHVSGEHNPPLTGLDQKHSEDITMHVKRVAGALGAELKAVNLSEGLDTELAQTLRALLNEHEVLFIRDQSITPADQKALAEIFGPLQTHPAYQTVEGLPEVMILESTRENPSKIEQWHSDMTFRTHPPSVTVLRGMTIPEVGGDTLFASMTAAYDGLSIGM
jgi:taurine dioxygenase